MKDLNNDPTCRAFDSKEQYVLIKDNTPTKPDAYLIIPSRQITGIEDSQIFSTPFLNLWKDAWYRSRKYPGQPAALTGLAINSVHGRTQNQLHIHISCVRRDVRKLLEEKDKDIPFYPNKAVTLHLPPNNNSYEAVKVNNLTRSSSPFEVIQEMSGVKGHMADQSIAVFGSQKPDEYYVLNTSYNQGTANLGSAEELLDQTCKAGKLE